MARPRGGTLDEMHGGHRRFGFSDAIASMHGDRRALRLRSELRAALCGRDLPPDLVEDVEECIEELDAIDPDASTDRACVRASLLLARVSVDRD